MRFVRPAGVVALGALVVGALAAVGWRAVHTEPTHAAPMISPSAAIVDMQNALESVAEGVHPAVVSITSRMTVSGADMDDMQMGPMGAPGPQMPHMAIGTGSGFIVRPDGYILTNDHVVSGASQVNVQLDDGRQFTGTVKRDPRSDLAIVKIDANNLPTLNLAEADTVKVGQYAIAFGSPFGLQDTMTVGVISAVRRPETIGGGSDQRFYPNLIQTDASINPGNSGGPLVDIYGNVVGVNVAIGSPNGGNVGIGFAIPATTARYVMDQLITRGSVTRGFLGFVPDDLTPADQTRYGAKQGALVSAVEDGSPADRAGLKVEDVVTSFNGQPVTNSTDLRDLVARTAPSQQVQITVLRAGKQQTLTATIQAAPEQTAPQTPAPNAAPAPQQGKLGVQVTDMTPDVARQLGIDSTRQGAVVMSVVPGSPASEAGIMPGDIIMRVNNTPVASAADATSAIRSLNKGDQPSIIVWRDKNRVLIRPTIQ